MNSYNYITGREYTGGNLEKLNNAGGGAWMTWNQLQNAGYRIRKGSHGVKVCFKNRNYWLFNAKDCTLNGEPLNLTERVYTADAVIQEQTTEPVKEPEPVKVPAVIPEPANIEKTWSLNDGIITLHPEPSVTGKYNVNAICNMTVASVKDFRKKWLSDDPELLQVFIDEINNNKVESAEQKKIIFGGKPEKVNAEVAKIIKYLAKQQKLGIKKVDDKYLITDSFMIIECSADDIEKLADQVPSLLNLKEQGKLHDAWCYKEGKTYEIRGNCPDLVHLIDKANWNAETVVDFSKSLKTEDKLYESAGIYAATKMIDLFKEKIFRSSGNKNDLLTRVTDNYRVMVCPVRKYS